MRLRFAEGLKSENRCAHSMTKVKNVLFYVSPFPSNGIPLDFALGSADKLKDMTEQLTNAGVEVHLLTGESAAHKMQSHHAHCLSHCKKVILFKYSDLNEFGDGYPESVVHLFNELCPKEEKILQIKKRLVERGGAKKYDVVISFFAETRILKALFPGSKVLFFETGLVCHQPFEQFHSFDPYGTISEGSYITLQTQEDLESRIAELEQYRPILDSIRKTIVAFSGRYSGDITSLRGLRSRWKKVVLLALQPLGREADRRYFSHGYEIVEYVLNSLPRDVGLLVTEHPSFPEINREQHGYLAEQFPNYIYSTELQNCWSPSTICLPFVDAVVGVSSTVLLHAHALGIRTFSIGTSCFSALNSENNLDAFFQRMINDAAFKNEELHILDLISRYSVPKGLYTTAWLGDYLNRLMSAKMGSLPLIAKAADLARFYEARPFPKSIFKPPKYYQENWRSRPLALGLNDAKFARTVTGSTNVKAKFVIGVVLDHFGIGGTQNVILRLVRLIPDIHWVIFVEKRIPEEYGLTSNCEVVVFDASKAGAEPGARALAEAVFNFHKSCALDIFINPMHWREAALLAMPIIKSIVEVPIIYWEHNSFFYPMYSGKHELHLTRARVISDVDRVVLLNPYDQWHFATRYPEARSQVIANPVPSIDVGDLDESTRQKRILVVGRFDPQKRMDRIVPILKHFSKEMPDWKMVVLGDGYLRPRIQADIVSEGLEQHIEFLGYQPDASRWYREASIFASTSDFEGDPLTFMEAKAFGLPIVSFELFQNTRLRHQVDGYYVEQNDTRGFAEKLLELARDQGKREQMGAAAREHFLSYDNQVVVNQWCSLFEAIRGGTPFEQAALVVPPEETLQREAIHVAASLQYLMQSRMNDQAQRISNQVRASGGQKVDNSSTTSNQQSGSSNNLSRSGTDTARRPVSFDMLMREAAHADKTGDLSRALKHYQQCIEERPDLPHVRRLLAEVYLKLGLRNEAINQLETARRQRPDNKNIKRRLWKIRYPWLTFWYGQTPYTNLH